MGNIDNLISKFQNKSISDEELSELENWVKDSKDNNDYFIKSVQTDYLISSFYRKQEEIPNLSNLKKPIIALNSKKQRANLMKFAAIFIVALIASSTAYFYFFNPAETTYAPGEIIITNENGEKITVDYQIKQIVYNEEGEVSNLGSQVKKNPNTSEKDNNRLAYNTINVPKGKRIQLVLSDGTKVYLNSESSLRFPSHFPKTEQLRKVSITGEAVFEVHKDSLKPFIVEAGMLNIEVLGTRFNVDAYPQSKQISTTLAEGSVQINYDNEVFKLEPGEAGILSQNTDVLSVEKVNVANKMAWVDDRLLFINESFAEIQKKIERSYGVQIINKNAHLNDVRFNGDFDIKSETIEDVLDAFKAVDFFEYTYKNNIVTIKK
ncbi:FecR family protein [Zunongwangia endophytica]|uniref:FecR family protein n=1 Tax=Zunongwangia endophytica TaxID=1808945 RepID=A0ABV8HBX5_9FLAO|nr:FecR family protein [Zunongwangia endophytica]MDN3593305.1 FecR family protein [Zunongwangia endophytica]MDN3596925.1 FecR family protein [Zunongwangia endophytica]